MRSTAWRVVTLFAGAGGADLGLSAAGMKHVACVDADPYAVETLRAAGFPGVLGTVGTEPITVRLGGRRRPVVAPVWRGSRRAADLLWGSPPCQPYSDAGNKLGSDDPRDGWGGFLDAVTDVCPSWVVVENVGGAPLAEWVRDLRDVGYRGVRGFSLNAANYGVPQRRHREFIVAGPVEIVLPRATHHPWADAHGLFPKVPSWVSLGDALPGLAAGVVPEGEAVVTGGRAATERWRLLELAPTVMTTEVKGTRAHGAALTFNGGPDRASDAAFLAVGRRRLTIPECAALQGFPADYPFRGPKVAQYRQIGNAVPPKVAEVIARAILAADRRRSRT